jgi:hypothetical protein
MYLLRMINLIQKNKFLYNNNLSKTYRRVTLFEK